MYEELKIVAELAKSGGFEIGSAYSEDRYYAFDEIAYIDFAEKATPSAVLALIAENEKIRGLLAEKLIGQTMLTGIIPENGGMTIGLEGGACAIMADVFGEQLYTSEAENYIELSFGSGKYPALGQIVVTVKRETGKTPHQLRSKAEQERDQLKAENEALRNALKSAANAMWKSEANMDNDASDAEAILSASVSGAGPRPNTGHGHVFPRADGAVAKCGGPGLCR